MGALLYLIGFYQRVAPGVITEELMAEFNFTGAALGNLSAFYFYSYVAMQVPTGLLADYWGPRKLLTLGAAVAALGTYLFSIAENAWWANFGRLMIGGSVAVAFVSMLKLAAHWLPAKQFSLASGLALFCGVLGAVFAGIPLRLLVDAFGWRQVMLVSAVFTGLITVAIWLLVRNDPTERGYKSYTSNPEAQSDRISNGIVAGILEVFRYRNTWLLFFVPGAIVGSVLTFAGLWGIPYLTTHYGMEKTSAAGLCSLLLISWAIGGPIFGGLSDHLGYRKPLYTLGCMVLLIGWGLLLLLPDLSHISLAFIVVVIGFFSGNMIIGFAFAKESTPARLAGTTSGIVNMGVMMGPMLLQPGVGWILDLNWAGEIVGGVRSYGLIAYRYAFGLMLAWLAIALLLILCTKETHCKNNS